MVIYLPLHGARSWRAVAGICLRWSLVTSLMGACAPSSLVDVQSPSNTIDPSQTHTAAVAAQMRAGTLLRVMSAFGGNSNVPYGVIAMSGTLTDELSESFSTAGFTGDSRNVLKPGLTGSASLKYGYDAIQTVRVYAGQAREALALYATDAPGMPHAWQGELYAIQGYAVLWLAELYCSGIPLSEAPFVGAQQPTRGFTTEELFTRAVALFDSAIVAGADSARYLNLARVGKGRALLGLGSFAAADSAVRSVPTDFVYFVQSATSSSDGSGYFAFPQTQVPGAFLRVQDHEGGNGLVWSTDPRTAVVTVDTAAGPMLWPAKYNVDPETGIPDPLTPRIGVSLRLADGLEARLIQAEVALHAGDPSWLSQLNLLRATCVGTAACAPVPNLIAAPLSVLDDPGTPDARLDLLMQERAMWLYLTGHREGDLRRMAHVYGRAPETLWPTGTISIPAFPPRWPQPAPTNGAVYGSDVVYGPDQNEQLHNPLYGGCYDTNP